MELDSSDVFSSDNDFPIASKGKRFLNLLIDTIVFYLMSFIFGFIMVAFFMSEEQMIQYVDTEQSTIQDYLIAFSIFFVYYFGMEYFFKGKTVGKFLTKTRAVRIDNSRLDPKEAALRTLSRLVPFEAFSFLGSDPSGWHDKWTQTIVIEDKGWDM